jgi:ribosomal protein S18 acetylase RimI-like enzyme
MQVQRLGAGESDVALDALRLLKAPDGYPTPTSEYLVRFLSRPDNVLIVATMDGVPVGFLLAYLLDRADRDQQMMFLYEIGVAESHRRRGIGTRMITQLKRICSAQNVMKMWVPTGRSNVAATRLYASTGATPLPSGDEVTYAYARESFTTTALE